MSASIQEGGSTNCFSGNVYSNVFPSTSAADKSDECYYNVGGNKLKPATAISVDDLPDVVLQPEFRQKLDKQFEVSLTTNNMFTFSHDAVTL